MIVTSEKIPVIGVDNTRYRVYNISEVIDMTSENEAMKAMLLERINAALPDIDDVSLRKISGAIDVTMTQFDVHRRCTDIAVRTDDYPDEVKQYIISRKIEGVSKLTLRNKAFTLRMFFRTVNKPVRQITTNDIRVYLYRYQETRKISNRSLDQIRVTLSAFWTWMCNNDIVDRDITKNIQPIRYEKKQRVAMNDFELEVYRDACTKPRDKAMFNFMYSTGCRASELTNVKLSDINWNESTVLLHGKGNKDRVVALNPRAIISMMEYLNERSFESEYLFARARAPHDKVTVSTIEKMIRDLESKVCDRVPKHVTPHIVRHTTATRAVNAGMPIEQVQKVLGHANISTTQIYAEVNETDVHNNMLKLVV